MNTKEVTGLIKSHMNGWTKDNRTEAQCERELLGLADALITAFSKGQPAGALTPTRHNVASIVVEEMSKWSPTFADFDALSERLTRYFLIYYAQPVQHAGLPGNPMQASEAALGRRSSNKQALMSSTTGLILPS